MKIFTYNNNCLKALAEDWKVVTDTCWQAGDHLLEVFPKPQRFRPSKHELRMMPDGQVGLYAHGSLLLTFSEHGLTQAAIDRLMPQAPVPAPAPDVKAVHDMLQRIEGYDESAARAILLRLFAMFQGKDDQARLMAWVAQTVKDRPLVILTRDKKDLKSLLTSIGRPQDVCKDFLLEAFLKTLTPEQLTWVDHMARIMAGRPTLGAWTLTLP